MSTYRRLEQVREQLYDLSNNERNGLRKLTAEQMAIECGKLFGEIVQIEQDMFEERTTGSLSLRAPLHRPGLTIDPIYEYDGSQLEEVAA